MTPGRTLLIGGQRLRIAVTGAAGFLGTYLTRRLVSDLPDSRVIGLSRRPPQAPVAGVRYVDRLPEGQVEELDIFFHLAGSGGIAASISDPAGDLESNTGQTLTYLERIRAAGTRCTFLLASSCAVYGRVEGAAVENRPPAPQTPYGASKLGSEAYVSVYRHLYGIDGRIARIANPYGLGQRKLAVYELVARALQEDPPLRVRGHGQDMRDFIHADDVARALLAIALVGKAGGIYNVGSGEPVTLQEVAALVASAVGFSAGDVTFEDFQEPGTIGVFYPDIASLRELGFEPHHSLPEGIKDIVEWVRCQA